MKIEVDGVVRNVLNSSLEWQALTIKREMQGGELSILKAVILKASLFSALETHNEQCSVLKCLIHKIEN